MSELQPDSVGEEERLVAELGLLGIRYLSRVTPVQPSHVRAPELLLADLVRQPSARVRCAVIPVLLAHPEFADAIPAALERLTGSERTTLESLYMAAVLLQEQHAERLRSHMGGNWRRLPDPERLALDRGLPVAGEPVERLSALGREHGRRTGTNVNWSGTFQHAATYLLRQWDLESRWSQ